MKKKILIGVGVLIVLLFIIGVSNSGTKTANVSTTPTQQPQATAVPTVEQTTNVTPTTRKLTQEELDQIVEVDLSDDMMITLDYASTIEGAKLYRKIGYLVNAKKMNGIPFIEIVSDPIVDANPKTDSVQLGMIYEYEGALTSQVKQQILSDFQKIRTLAEEDRSLVLQEAGGLRLLVITFHDKKGKARGELEQLYIDPEPKWSEWK